MHSRAQIRYLTAASEHSLKSVGIRMVFSCIMMTSRTVQAARAVPPVAPRRETSCGLFLGK